MERYQGKAFYMYQSQQDDFGFEDGTMLVIEDGTMLVIARNHKTNPPRNRWGEKPHV